MHVLSSARRRLVPLLALTLVVSLLPTIFALPALAATEADLRINEIRIDQPSDDLDEFFELAGPADTDLTPYTYVVIGDGTGGSGVVEAAIPLAGLSLNSDGFFVAAEGTFSLGTADLTTTLDFENSDNVTHLLVDSFSGSTGDDLDTNDDGTLDVIPWTSVVDSIALVEEENPPAGTEYHYGPPSIGPDGSFVPGHIFWCETDTWAIGEFSGGDETPGAANGECDAPPPPPPPPSDAQLVITEIMQDPSAVGDSEGEWFEVYNAGTATVDLDGWTIRDDGTNSFVVSGTVTIDPATYFVFGRNADSASNGGVSVDYEYPSGFALANGDDELVIEDLASAEVDRVAWDGGPTFPDPTGASMTLGDLAADNNLGENWCEATSSFGAGDLGTPGAANDACETEPPPPPPAMVPISEIQGTGHLSPYAGTNVITSGVVTAVAFAGFYLQDPDGDGDASTSEGIYVDLFQPPVEVGDYLEVTATVVENIPGGPSTGNLSITQLVSPTLIDLGDPPGIPDPVVIGKSGILPPTTVVISDSELPVNLQDVPGTFNPEIDGIDFYEALEGMLVTVEDPQTVSATRTFGNFSSEFFTVPNRGKGTIAPKDALTRRGGIELQPDPDNTGDQNPERVQIQFDASIGNAGTLYPGEAPTFNVGSRLNDVTGVVGYSFGNYEVNATELVTGRQSRLKAEDSRLRSGKYYLTVASYNVLNLSPDASDDAQRSELAEHIADNLNSPDIVALQEIQDNSGETNDGTTAADQTLQALVDEIAAAGGPTYSFFDVAPADGSSGGIPGGNIRNAFLYDPERVELVDFLSLTPDVLAVAGVGEPNAFNGTRNPLLGIFEFNGRQVQVINNHFTSRFGSSPIFGGPQPFVQAGEADREAQAGALNDFVDFILEGDDDARVMVVGDLNTFQWTNDLAEILPGTGGEKVLSNLVAGNRLTDDRDDRYTFIFDGNSQALDHFFVTSNLEWVSKLDIVHTNVDFARVSSEVTASDHEPLLARFLIWPPFKQFRFDLQVLHASDLEGGVDALDRAPNFAALVDKLEDNPTVDASITLSAGDNWIPGPFFNAAGDLETFRIGGVFNDAYNVLYGLGSESYASLREGGGRVDVSIMNTIGFDASAIGNHEFDLGSDAFESIIEPDFRGPGLSDDRWVGSQFPYLSSNLDFSGDGDLGNLFTDALLANTAFETGPFESAAGVSGVPKIAPSTYINVGGGEKIGVVGATTQVLESISSPGGTTVIGPTTNDMPALAAILQPKVDQLTAAGVNKIVLVSHLQQIALEEELVGLLEGVDIVIAGGSDTLLANPDDALRSGDVADEQYPLITTGADGDPAVVVSTDGEYSYLGQLVVKFNRNGELINRWGWPLNGLEDLDLSMNGPIKTESADVDAAWGGQDPFATGTKGAIVSDLVAAAQGVVIAKDSNVVGETSVFLEGRREKVRTEETNIGNLGAEANLWVAQSFDSTVVVSIKNGGGLRAEIGEIVNTGGSTTLLPPQANPLSGKLEGEISQLDIENSLRFNNGLTLLTLTAAELVAVLEHAVTATEPGATPGQFAQVAGVAFSFDPAQSPGSRIQSAALIDSSGTATEVLVSTGSIVGDPTRTFRIVTLNFLAGGGDSYPFPPTDRVDLVGTLTDPGLFDFAPAGSEQDAFAEFLGAFHGIGSGTPYSIAETAPAFDERIQDLTVRSDTVLP